MGQLARAYQAKKRKPPPPNFPTPQGQAHSQDDYGNPTTKRPGDVGTESIFPARSGARSTWRDMQGAHTQNQYRGKTGLAARKARAKKRGY